MRLEFDTTVSAPPLAQETDRTGSVDSAEVKSALTQGIKAAQAGNRAQARAFLLRATELDPRNENAWLWLASISEYPEELLGFLNHVLEINPENQRATEWKIATHSLLSKTFVQRGIDASQENHKVFAAECFQTALEYDDRNAVAWMWMAFLSDSNTVKISLLGKALAIEPANQSASTALEAARASILKDRFTRAKSAAIAGDHAEAINILDCLLEVKPDSIEAWTMKSHLSHSFDEKIRCFESILAIDPENIAAKAGRDSLLEIFGTAEAAYAESSKESDEANEDMLGLNTLYSFEPACDKSPTQELEVPAGFATVAESGFVNGIDNTPADEEFATVVVNAFETEIDDTPADAGFATAEERAFVNEIDNSPADDEFATVVVNAFETDIDDTPADAGFATAEVSAFVTEIDDTPANAGFATFLENAFQTEIEHPTEEEYEHEHRESVAEPFATLAEETTEPVEAPASSCDNEPAVGYVNDYPLESAAEEVSESSSFDADPQSETVAFSYDMSPETALPDGYEEGPEDGGWAEEASESPILMPAESLPLEESPTESAAKTFVESTEVLAVKAESIECPFCRETNDAQVISCQSCKAVLTLSDLELLLANQNSDNLTLRQAVEEMERQRQTREFSPDELTTLGLGHLNLRNLQSGYSCLHEASKLNPNNVVLGGQVNSLLIRLDEIKQQEEAHLKMPKGKSILVVDDSPTVRKLIAGKLEKCGHEVVCANDGVEALERLENLVPDLVLLDITMPRMDGYQVCKHIRSNDSTKDVTVVMISGKDGFFDKVRGRMAGTTGYITKPFGPETLMKAVEMYLSGEAPQLDEV